MHVPCKDECNSRHVQPTHNRRPTNLLPRGFCQASVLRVQPLALRRGALLLLPPVCQGIELSLQRRSSVSKGLPFGLEGSAQLGLPMHRCRLCRLQSRAARRQLRLCSCQRLCLGGHLPAEERRELPGLALLVPPPLL